MSSNNGTNTFKKAPPGFGRPLPPGTPVPNVTSQLAFKFNDYLPGVTPAPGVSVQPGGKRIKKRRRTKKRKINRKRKSRRNR